MTDSECGVCFLVSWFLLRICYPSATGNGDHWWSLWCCPLISRIPESALTIPAPDYRQKYESNTIYWITFFQRYLEGLLFSRTNFDYYGQRNKNSNWNKESEHSTPWSLGTWDLVLIFLLKLARWHMILPSRAQFFHPWFQMISRVNFSKHLRKRF